MTKKSEQLDTMTAIKLGMALFKVLARENEESEFDEFGWEDSGVLLNGAMVEIDYDTANTVKELLDDSTEEN